MSKSFVRNGIIFCVIILFAGTFIIPSSGEPNLTNNLVENNKSSFFGINSKGIILYVGGNGEGNYTLIQDAIDNTSDGDTVFVFDDSSPYYENVIIHKSINLYGENSITTHIIGDSLDNTIYVNANFINIKGFHISDGNPSGIRLFECEDCSIIDNIIETNKIYGLHLSHSMNNNISGNHIHLNHNGIKLFDKSNYNNIKDNTIENNQNATFLEHSSKNTINSNLIKDNYCGLKLYSKSRSNNINGNTFSNNDIGIFLGGTIYPTFIFNIILDGSTNNKIIKNNFFDNKQDAFFQNSRRNIWWRNYWNKSRILPKLIFGEIFICRLQGIPPTPIEHHIPWVPKIDLRPALKQF